MLIVFTDIYLPENSGLERFNYLALREFVDKPANFRLARGEQVSEIVERDGGYGWTGNDLYENYLLRKKFVKSLLKIIKFVPWPEMIKPRLCLLGPEELSLEDFLDRRDFKVSAPQKYDSLVREYFQTKNWFPEVFFLDGQVEKQIRLGNTDLAIDIVYTGKTVREERLAIYQTIFDQSGFVLITKDI